jgi:hypothetical protein
MAGSTDAATGDRISLIERLDSNRAQHAAVFHFLVCISSRTNMELAGSK